MIKDDLSIIGIDEAGRGALCGDMYMAACKLKKEIIGLNDSKKLSPKKREKLFDEIKENSEYLIVSFSPNMIDEFGLSYLLKLGLECFKMHFKDEVDKLVFDGNLDYQTKIKTLIKADLKIKSVMAASILAKVSRDRRMNELDSVYPNYQIKSHKGYATLAHRNIIKKIGISAIHRKSFCKNFLSNQTFSEKSLFD